MIALDVNVRSTEDNTNFAVAYIVEEYINNEWREKERLEVTTNTPEADRTFVLDLNQRMRVEKLTSRYELVQDVAQRATMKVPVVEPHRPIPDVTEYSERKGWRP